MSASLQFEVGWTAIDTKVAVSQVVENVDMAFKEAISRSCYYLAEELIRRVLFEEKRSFTNRWIVWHWEPIECISNASQFRTEVRLIAHFAVLDASCGVPVLCRSIVNSNSRVSFQPCQCWEYAHWSANGLWLASNIPIPISRKLTPVVCPTLTSTFIGPVANSSELLCSSSAEGLPLSLMSTLYSEDRFKAYSPKELRDKLTGAYRNGIASYIRIGIPVNTSPTAPQVILIFGVSDIARPVSQSMGLPVDSVALDAVMTFPSQISPLLLTGLCSARCAPPRLRHFHPRNEPILWAPPVVEDAAYRDALICSPFCTNTGNPYSPEFNLLNFNCRVPQDGHLSPFFIDAKKPRLTKVTRKSILASLDKDES